MSLAGPPGHLTRRFASFLTARGLDAGEQRWVAARLRDDEVAPFWSQPVADQRHAHDCARHVAARVADRPDLVRAALLHDIGKRHARLGAIGRSLATVAAALRSRGLGIRGPASFDRYTRHGPVGAEELAATGAERLVVEFTAAHHGPRPATIPADEWALLKQADQVT
ncbi:MAG: HDIG domain-containing metalloprotein [Acidimicrobiia bacterium]